METYLTTRAVWSPTIYRQVLCPAQNESCGHNFDGPAKDISCSTDGVRHSLPLHTALRFNAMENNSMPQIADYSVYVLRYNVIRAHCEKPQDYQRTHCTENIDTDFEERRYLAPSKYRESSLFHSILHCLINWHDENRCVGNNNAMHLHQKVKKFYRPKPLVVQLFPMQCPSTAVWS